jgi:hypothetical protein
MAMRDPICEKLTNLDGEARRCKQALALRCADAAGAVSTRFFGWGQDGWNGYLVTSTGGVG